MKGGYEKLPASSLVKHIGGLILKTFPCSPPLPMRTPSSAIVRSKRKLSCDARYEDLEPKKRKKIER